MGVVYAGVERMIRDRPGTLIQKMDHLVKLEEASTCGCIKGHAEEIFGGANICLSEILGVSWETTNELVFPFPVNYMSSQITRQDAINILEHLRDTGHLDWSLMKELRGKNDEKAD